MAGPGRIRQGPQRSRSGISNRLSSSKNDIVTPEHCAGRPTQICSNALQTRVATDLGWPGAASRQHGNGVDNPIHNSDTVAISPVRPRAGPSPREVQMTSPTTIADEVEALHQGLAGQIPDQVLSPLLAEQKMLDAAGVPEVAAKAGSAMPDGDLLDAHGQATTLTAARVGKPAVVVFYRGAWCPYCNVALRNYQANLVPELDARGIALIAVSPQ